VVGDLHTPRAIKQFAALSQTLAHHPGVAATSPVIPVDGAVYEFTVVPTTSPQDTATSALISTIRTQYDTKFTGSSHVYVGGITAIFDDFAKTLSDKLPLFLAVIVFLGCLLLLVAFRSVLVPLVAAAMNLLATGASFGLVVAVFQWGWGSHLLNSGTGLLSRFYRSS
jgi:RND superfamily putative drug exporter